MVGIVVVSHSAALADAAVELALEMAPSGPPPIAVAAGAAEGATGTDAVAIAEGISSVASPDGVLVLMDLGSALLSAEMALEFAAVDCPVRLVAAPFVEGLVVAVVAASSGLGLDEVARQAVGALSAKQEHLGGTSAPSVPSDPAPVRHEAAALGEITSRARITNPLGLHARPAATVVGAASGFSATVTITKPGRPPASALSQMALVALGTKAGDEVTITASGPDAAAAVATVADLIAGGFGELAPPAAGNANTPMEDTTAAKVPAPALGARKPLGVSAGIGVGPVAHLSPPAPVPQAAAPLPPDQREHAANRIMESAKAVAADLADRASTASGEAAAVLRADAAMATDPTLLDAAAQGVRDAGADPARAVFDSAESLAALLSEVGGATADRAADVRDVAARIIARLLGVDPPGLPQLASEYVLVAEDLSPADTALLDPALCKGLVTAQGSPTSHTAILARALGIPAVVAAPAALDIPAGTTVLVDGTTGEVISDPPRDRITQCRANTASAGPLAAPGATRDGHRVQLLANVAALDSAVAARAAGAEGVGLLRTELVFLGAAREPTAAAQVAAYKAVFDQFAGRKVVIRTLDAGADKPLAFLNQAPEANPALGVRGYRTSWAHLDVLRRQLEAIARAASDSAAEVWTMAPMVATADEAAEFAALARAAGLAKAGVMIETPSAALTCAEILRHVDFVSLGTNDLTQYTMAADRQLGAVAHLNDPWQPAVLRLVKAACEAGEAAGKPVGVCGEAAADPALAAVLVGLGATSLSMAPAALAAVAAKLAQTTLAECREQAAHFTR
ncbi:MAG: phosphoenolpyruvate--protein phosphotransferase [Propionibacteriaceae bacterium]|jgi:phosphotransferase system enzyme I (PtsI)|nr:phosphoenolpyruvate--protein phosphotransferase [Propionibacteriaceae bacterium]